MTALKITLQVIVVLLSFVLTLLILMHKGKGGGLSDMFGRRSDPERRYFRCRRKEPEPLDRYHRSGVGGLDYRPRHDDQVQPRLIGLHAI